MTKLEIAEMQIQKVFDTPLTTDELKTAIALFLSVGAETARNDTETLETCFADRYFAIEEEQATKRGTKKSSRAMAGI